MRRRFAVPLISALALAPWAWFHPDSPPLDQPATFVSAIDIPRNEDWAGGFSGIELSRDGSVFHLITDRGHLARGKLVREDGHLKDLEITDVRPLSDRNGKVLAFPHNDAEGIAIGPAGEIYVSFEHAHRVLVYDTWESAAEWPSYTRSWRAMSNNKGLEALALTNDGTILTLPEEINAGAWEALVYHRKPKTRWVQHFTIPVDAEFSPVGADMGPDGKLYLLERGLYPFGFYSRVRRMVFDDKGFSNIETVLRTGLGTHGNLEGLAVWQDDRGSIRLTMVSDDNFHFFMRAEVVEYILTDGLALTAE